MRCCGRTSLTLKRCKNETKYFFCSKHKGYWLIVIGLIGTISGIFQDLVLPIQNKIFRSEHLYISKIEHYDIGPDHCQYFNFDESDISKLEQELTSELLEKYELEKELNRLTLTLIANQHEPTEVIAGESISDDLGVSIKGNHNLNFTIANDYKNTIFLIDSLKLNWTFTPCSEITYIKEYYYVGPPGSIDAGSQVKTYEYSVNLSKKHKEKLLTENSFKYSFGDVDKFKIKVNIPSGFGIYKYWITFRHQIIDTEESKLYRSELFKSSKCSSRIFVPIYDKEQFSRIKQLESELKATNTR